MKWYNKDKRKMLDIDSVDGYVFIPAKEYIEQNPTEPDVNDYKEYGDRIELILSGTPYIFRGSDANEIYNLLIGNTKELLRG